MFMKLVNVQLISAISHQLTLMVVMILWKKMLCFQAIKDHLYSISKRRNDRYEQDNLLLQNHKFLSYILIFFS